MVVYVILCVAAAISAAAICAGDLLRGSRYKKKDPQELIEAAITANACRLRNMLRLR